MFLNLLMLICCKKEDIYEQKLNSNQIIPSGEWASDSDIHSGLSVRKNKIAFYQNEKFSSNDIFEYSIIDSIRVQDKNKNILSTYLQVYDSKDTTNYKILDRSNTNISLLINNNIIEHYRLKKK